MKIILRADVEKLGLTGEVKQVARGYARNYLIPKGWAEEATPQRVAWYQKSEERRKALKERDLQSAREAAAKISGVTLSFTRPVGDKGQLFGSVGRADIVKSLKASGHSVEKEAVLLENALKSVGDFEVEIRLHPGASANIRVSVLPRGG